MKIIKIERQFRRIGIHVYKFRVLPMEKFNVIIKPLQAYL